MIRDQPVENYLDATILAKSFLKQLLDGLYEGSGSCIGLPTLRAGDQVNISGVGKRFSGAYTLSKVTHTINSGGYQTRFEVTQRATSSLLQSLRKKLGDLPSPKVNETVVGIVRNNIDPDQNGRIQVYIPSLSDENLSNWARMATPMAGSGTGMYFLPDIDDKVLVTFEQGNINRPIIVGSVWNDVERPPEGNLDGMNRIRAIRTRAGHNITLDDTSGSEQIVIQDNAGSTITLQADGSINIEAATNLNLSASNGDINLNATNVNVTVSGAMDVN